MEDSSSNPYIPQESEQIRQKVYERQSPLGRVVKWALIATAIVTVLVGACLFFVVPRTTAVDQPARTQLADALQPPDQTLKRVPVSSTLGFKLDYDNRVYSSYAEVGDSTSGTDGSAAVLSGETYENNELRTSRAYNYVRIRPIESVEGARSLATQPPELEIFATVSDKDLTDAAANAENKGLSKISLFVKLDTDKRLAKRVGDDKTVVTIDATKPVSTTIANVEYQKVRFTTTNDNYRIANVRYDDCYYAIQNDMPYSICVSNVRPTNVSAASLVEQVFDSVAYEQPATGDSDQVSDQQKTSYALPLARLTQATKETSDDADDTGVLEDEEGEAPLITVTPQYYADADSLAAIAKNQPSVVRIGTLYCANLALRLESGETATTLSDACAGNMATGVFVSSEGHIATTGHAIIAQKKAAINGYINFASDQSQMLDRLQRVLDYLLKIKKILQSDADYIKTGAQIGDQEALAKIENIASVIPDNYIVPIDEKYTYAVQPTDKPIVVNRSDSNKPAFAYSDSVLSAEYVAHDYDASKSVQEVFGSATPATDVGIIKVKGNFQAVPVAASEDMKANDTLNTIGYAAYTDSSLTVDKIRNAPIVTVSKVEQAYKKEDTRLIQTTMPVLPGNDGAPVFNSLGELVGFAVYGLSYCPDQLCFANGTVRSSGELAKLLDKRNIKLASVSEPGKAWREGVDQYLRSNYAGSASAFGQSASYTYNRWSVPLQKLAASHKGSEKDTSLMNQLQVALIAILIVAAVMTIVLSVLFGIHRRRISQLRVGHYGAALPPEPSVATPVYSQAGVQPIAPSQPVEQAHPPTQQPVDLAQQPQLPQAQPPAPTQPPTIPQDRPPSEDPFYRQ